MTKKCVSGSTLIPRNVTILGRRTSVKLEESMWEALNEICLREDMSHSELCSLVERRRSASSLTAAIRVYILSYFKTAATEAGHANAGHGAMALRRAED